jgi:hypothetical protein
VPPTATWPKLTEAGTTEIVAAPGVLCWFDANLDAPVNPMQPELDRIAKSRRIRAATGIAFWHTEFIHVARFIETSNHGLILNLFIHAIVVWPKKGGLLSHWTFIGQVREPAPRESAQREAASRTPTLLRGPPNSIGLGPATIYGIVAETSAELTLSRAVESTDVTT